MVHGTVIPPVHDDRGPAGSAAKAGCRPRIRGATIVSLTLLLSVNPCRAHEYFWFFYQRTALLENLTAPAPWWANPAAMVGDTSPMFLATNVAPLGNRYLIAEGKGVLPFGDRFAVGLGLLGAGLYEAGSSSARTHEGGFSYQSSFAFERPRFQLAAAARHPRIGALGAVATIGADGRSVATDSTVSEPSGGVIIGVLSPRLFIPLYLSAALSFIHHELSIEFWDRVGKLGLCYRGDHGLIEGSLEYTFDLDRGFGVFTPERAWYDILKLLLSVRVHRTVAVLAGVSTDLTDFTPYYQGSSIHLGAEFRASSRFPFVGGYDLAFHPGQDWRILHRVWFGYRFPGAGIANPRNHESTAR